VKNDGWTYSDRIRPEDGGRTVAEFYPLRYPGFHENEWRRRIRDGKISLNGDPAGPDDVLSTNDVLVYRRPPWEEPDVPADFEVLHQDPSVLVLAKPSGLPVLPGGDFLENTLLRLARRRFGPSCAPLHRLGRGTSGAILFTRNGRSARMLCEAMSARRIRKIYLALVSGIVPEDDFTIEAPIGPVPYAPLGTIHAFNPGGRPSLSRVRVIERRTARKTTLLEVSISTGRPHQIRIHLGFAGFPLAGDPLYSAGGLPRRVEGYEGGVALPGDSGYHLHSWKIGFAHPDTGREMEIASPPPPILALPSGSFGE
jgi:23S rRNA pseudouridine1911/1915/1917 synthase